MARKVNIVNQDFKGTGQYKGKTRNLPVIKGNRIPKGWKENMHATTAPQGWKWVWNGKPLFGGEYRSALMRKSAKATGGQG